jgi:hypothetical protein
MTLDNKNKLEEIETQLEKYLKKVKADPETLKKILSLQRIISFGKYTLMNYLYIMSQNENAEQIKGFKDWNKNGRKVKKGEKALKVFAPFFANKATVEKAENQLKDAINAKADKSTIKYLTERAYFLKNRPLGFHTVPVFDISQTTGEPLKEAQEMTGANYIKYNGKDKTELEKLYAVCQEFLKVLNIPVIEKAFYKHGGMLRKYQITEAHEIVINSEISIEGKIAVLFHEIGHYKFNHIANGTESTTAEPEAELFGYLVINYFNINTLESTNSHIASHLETLETDIYKTFKHVIKMAFEFLKEITEYSEAGKAELKQHKAESAKTGNNTVKAGV